MPGWCLAKQSLFSAQICTPSRPCNSHLKNIHCPEMTISMARKRFNMLGVRVLYKNDVWFSIPNAMHDLCPLMPIHAHATHISCIGWFWAEGGVDKLRPDLDRSGHPCARITSWMREAHLQRNVIIFYILKINTWVFFTYILGKYRDVKNYSCTFEISCLSAANFGKFKLISRNLAGIILHHS